MAIGLLELSRSSLCHGAETPGDLHGCSLCFSWASAPLPWFLAGWVFDALRGFDSSYTDDSDLRRAWGAGAVQSDRNISGGGEDTLAGGHYESGDVDDERVGRGDDL